MKPGHTIKPYFWRAMHKIGSLFLAVHAPCPAPSFAPLMTFFIRTVHYTIFTQYFAICSHMTSVNMFKGQKLTVSTLFADYVALEFQ